MRIHSLLVAAALSLAAGSAAEAAVGVPGVDFSNPGYGSGNTEWTMGYGFTANSSTDVVGLATWNEWSSTAPAEVGLWDASGTLLASAEVSSASPTMGEASWSYAEITPVELTAGGNYYVGAYGASSDWTGNYYGGTVVNPNITLNGSGGYHVGGFSAPTNGGLNYYGGNVILGVPGGVPEPATWAMLILGVAMIGAAARRRGVGAVLAA